MNKVKKRPVKKAKANNRRGTYPGQPSITIFGVPKHLKKEFRAKCFQRGVSMREAILDFMQHYVKVS